VADAGAADDRVQIKDAAEDEELYTIMIMTLIRVLVDLACMLWAIFGGLFYYITGDTRHAVTTVLMSAIIAFVVRPNNVDLANYKEWQKKRSAA
jgi:hypothetical protein